MAIVREDFDYANGNLTGNGDWEANSVSGSSNSLQIESGVARAFGADGLAVNSGNENAVIFASFDLTPPFAITYRLKITNDAEGHIDGGLIFGNADQSGYLGLIFVCNAGASGANKLTSLTIAGYDNAADTSVSFPNGVPFTFGEFHDLAIVDDGTDVKGYLDGVFVDGLTITPSSRTLSEKVLFLDTQRDHGANVAYFDDVAIVDDPAAPTIGTATATSSSAVTVTWTDNSDNETGFEIEYDTANTFDVDPQTTTAAADAESKSVTGLQPETEYFFRVRATNAAGNSDYSDASSGATTLSSVATIGSRGIALYGHIGRRPAISV